MKLKLKWSCMLGMVIIAVLLLSVNITACASEAPVDNMGGVEMAFEPRSVIIDTDFASDADDILAIRLALCYQDMGMLDVKAIMLSTNYSKSPQAVSSLCHYDGYKNIPVGMNTNYKYSVQVPTKYVDVLCRYGGYADFTDSTKLYRKILSQSEDKISIVTLGFLQNIQCLMNSGPDEYSPLTGMELILQKVDTLYVLGGNLNGMPSFNFYWTGETVNNAAQFVNTYYPGNLVYLPVSLGGDVWNGSYYQTDWRKKDPVTAALEANGQKSGVVGWDTAGIYGMVKVMFDVNQIDGMFLLPGTMWIGDNGCTEWVNNSLIQNRKILMKTMPGDYYSNKIDSLLYRKFKGNE